ncbi:MAG: S41 family peptidase [Flavobacteriales bacterium]
MLRTILPLTFLGHATLLDAQSDPICPCTDQLDALIAKVETNYSGYAIEFHDDRRTTYSDLCERLRSEARQANVTTCWSLLRRYVDHFQDGHLFISDVWGEYDSTYRQPEPRVELDMNGANTEHVDAIEGQWMTHDGRRVSIIPAGADASDGTFAAVLMEEGEQKGEVKARFSKLVDGSYDAVVLNEKGVAVHPAIYQPAAKGARIVRGSLLMMPPFTWVRVSPTTSNACVIDVEQPLAPQVFPYGSDGSVWVASLPSCNPMFTTRLDSLLRTHDADLSQARLLIIDLRSNEGGSSGMTRGLDRYLGPHSPPPADTAKAVVLSSEDNIKYFTYMERDGWVPPGLVQRMKEHTGELVEFSDPETSSTAPTEPATDATEHEASGPKQVALLTDRGVVSAGEAFCLRARNYPRVKQFGEATAGCIDHQNVTMVYFGCEAAGYLLGYPTLASSRYLPQGGYNQTGIVPDVNLPTNVDDPYRAIVEWYAK